MAQNVPEDGLGTAGAAVAPVSRGKWWETDGKSMENHGKNGENHGKNGENHGKNGGVWRKSWWRVASRWWKLKIAMDYYELVTKTNGTSRIGDSPTRLMNHLRFVGWSKRSCEADCGCLTTEICKKNDWQLGFLGIKGVDHWNFRWLKTEECALGSATVWNRGLFFIESGIWDSKSRCFTMIWYKYTNGRCDPTPCFSVRIASKTHVPIVPQMTWETNMWI